MNKLKTYPLEQWKFGKKAMGCILANVRRRKLPNGKKENEELCNNAIATTGVRLDFHTDSDFVHISLSSVGKYEVKIDGVFKDQFILMFVISMFCVGFLEEIIFRGFLFKALSKENVTSAIIISSVTFGIGHIINLFGGAELISTLLQICYAIAIGFLFTIIFHKSGSLWPCIVAHSLTNALSAFSCDASLGWEIAIAIVLILLPIGYALWIWFFGNKTENPKNQEKHKEK